MGSWLLYDFEILKEVTPYLDRDERRVVVISDSLVNFCFSFINGRISGNFTSSVGFRTVRGRFGSWKCGGLLGAP